MWVRYINWQDEWVADVAGCSDRQSGNNMGCCASIQADTVYRHPMTLPPPSTIRSSHHHTTSSATTTSNQPVKPCRVRRRIQSPATTTQHIDQLSTVSTLTLDDTYHSYRSTHRAHTPSPVMQPQRHTRSVDVGRIKVLTLQYAPDASAPSVNATPTHTSHDTHNSLQQPSSDTPTTPVSTPSIRLLRQRSLPSSHSNKLLYPSNRRSTITISSPTSLTTSINHHSPTATATTTPKRRGKHTGLLVCQSVKHVSAKCLSVQVYKAGYASDVTSFDTIRSTDTSAYDFVLFDVSYIEQSDRERVVKSIAAVRRSERRRNDSKVTMIVLTDQFYATQQYSQCDVNAVLHSDCDVSAGVQRVLEHVRLSGSFVAVDSDNSVLTHHDLSS